MFKLRENNGHLKQAAFSHLIAREIAMKVFQQLLESLLGENDLHWTFGDSADAYTDLFATELEALGITPSENRLEVIKDTFNDIKRVFENTLKKRYYK